MNVRALQRTLFRAQCDPMFLEALVRGDSEAVRSSDLDASGLATLLAADPTRIAADPGGRRRAQVLSNLAAEFLVSCRLMEERASGEGAVAAFLSAPEFHDAVRTDRSLPFAFADYAARKAAETDDVASTVAVGLERATAEARRGPRPGAAPPAGCVALSSEARLFETVGGATDAVAAASALAATGATTGFRRLFAEIGGAEAALIVATRAGIREADVSVRVERLEPLVAELLSFASETPRAALALAAFGVERDVSAEDVLAFVDELVVDGVLTRG